ncbi:hypothetical protein R1flu_016666 [Riccia fluitans]|uniref:Uncharacterized protein n=1 Tax=Riccia fluitans TaxID=41844 RepID=A0ABD1YMU8_9MARC
MLLGQNITAVDAQYSCELRKVVEYYLPLQNEDDKVSLVALFCMVAFASNVRIRREHLWLTKSKGGLYDDVLKLDIENDASQQFWQEIELVFGWIYLVELALKVNKGDDLTPMSLIYIFRSDWRDAYRRSAQRFALLYKHGVVHFGTLKTSISFVEKHPVSEKKSSFLHARDSVLFPSLDPEEREGESKPRRQEEEPREHAAARDRQTAAADAPRQCTTRPDQTRTSVTRFSILHSSPAFLNQSS